MWDLFSRYRSVILIGALVLAPLVLLTNERIVADREALLALRRRLAQRRFLLVRPPVWHLLPDTGAH